MGYVHALKIFMIAIMNEKTSDDQRNLNSVCHSFSTLKVDEDCVIFKNIAPYQKLESLYESGAFFGQTPGIFTFNRMSRGFAEYSQFLIPELILIILVMYFLYLHFVLKK
jgi:hypothetical protein